MTKLKLFHVVERKMYHARQTFKIKLPFVNSTKSLIFDLTKITIAQTLRSYIQYDCEGYALHYQTLFTELKSSHLVFKLCPVLFGYSFSKLSSGCSSERKSESP